MDFIRKGGNINWDLSDDDDDDGDDGDDDDSDDDDVYRCSP